MDAVRHVRSIRMGKRWPVLRRSLLVLDGPCARILWLLVDTALGQLERVEGREFETNASKGWKSNSPSG
jgi:hypothetical protein